MNHELPYTTPPARHHYYKHGIVIRAHLPTSVQGHHTRRL